MKTNFKTLALAASLLIAPLAAALATTPGTVEPKEPTAIEANNSLSVNAFRVAGTANLRMFIQKNDQSAVRVELKNEEGELFYESAIGKRANGKAYLLNLSELPNGHYTIEVSNRDKKVVKAFDLTTPARQVAVK